MDHRSKRGTEDESLPEYLMDYCFPGDEGGQKLTILVVVGRHSKMTKAVVAPSKGSTGRYAVRMVVDPIKGCGDKDLTVIVKSDQEPAIKLLVDDVCMAMTGARTIVEQAPKRVERFERHRWQGGPVGRAVLEDFEIVPWMKE